MLFVRSTVSSSYDEQRTVIGHSTTAGLGAWLRESVLFSSVSHLLL